MKNKTTALILAVLVGGLGIDRFYLGYTGLGILKLLTGGCFGIMWIIDIINIANGSLKPADGSDYDTGLPTASQSQQPTVDAIQKLSTLHDQGILSDEDYSKMLVEAMTRLGHINKTSSSSKTGNR